MTGDVDPGDSGASSLSIICIDRAPEPGAESAVCVCAGGPVTRGANSRPIAAMNDATAVWKNEVAFVKV